MKKAVSLFINLILLSTTTFTQDHSSVNGIITDSESGETLVSATVAVKGENRGTSSTAEGYFSINLKAGTYTIICTHIGYQSFEQEITVKDEENLELNIELAPDEVQFSDVIVESEAIQEEQRNIGRARVSSELIRDLPVVLEPDVFRSVQLLPGVKAASDFSSGLYVRGGGPDQTLILLDETPVYNPSHFFGFFSTFNPDAVKDVQLYKGGYPAEYGGRLGSVLSVHNKNGNSEETGGTISLGMLASRISVESPFKYGSMMLAVRRSTLEPVLNMLSESLEMIPDKFYFYDVNGKINVDLSSNDRLSFGVYSGEDMVSLPFRRDASIRLNYGNRIFNLQWNKIVSDRFFSSVSVTGSRYFNQPDLAVAGTAFERNNGIRDYSVKTDWEYLPSDSHTFSAGIRAGNLILQMHDRFNTRDTFRNKIESRYVSAYLQNTWEPAEKWVLNSGIRVNTFSEGNYLRLEPRASLEFRPVSRIRLQAAYGRYYQFLTLVSNEAFSGFDLWLSTNESVPPSYGDQIMFGTKATPADEYSIEMELYYRTMKDLFELDPFVPDPAGHEYQELFRFGEGFAYGAEVFFEKKAGAFRGFMGYTFGITRRKFPGFNADVLDDPAQGRFYPPKFDRTHDANIMMSYRFSEKWTLSAVFNYATGQAFTEPTGRTRFWNIPWETSSRNTFVIGNVNASRLPSYHRLDLSLSRFGTFFGLGEAEWQLQVINAYSRRNIWFYNYNFDDNPSERDEIELLPLIPSLTYTLNF